MKDTLRFRLSIYISLTMFLVGTLVAGMLLYDWWRLAKLDMGPHGMSVARQVSGPILDEMLKRDGAAIESSLNSVINIEDGLLHGPAEYIEVLDKDGVQLAWADNGGPGSRSFITPDGYAIEESTFPVAYGDGLAGFVRVGVSDKRLVSAMKENIWKAAAMLAIACLLGIIAAGRIAGWVSGPIAGLVKGAGEFSSGNLEYRVEPGSPGEMAALAASFNEMAAHLKDKVDSLDESRKEAEGLSARLAEAFEDVKQSEKTLQYTNEWVTDMAFRLEEANQELKAGKVQTDTIVHSIRDGIVALDAGGRIILMNPVAEEIFDIREDEAKGGDVKVLVDKLAARVEDSEEFLCKFMAAASAPETESAFSVTLIKPYRRVLRRVSSAIRDEEGNIKGRVVTFRDITREKEVDDMKTNFVSTVSHELRTPLTSIKGAISLLIESDIEDAETRREFLRIAEQNADRLISLITNLLDLSRMDEGRGGARFARLDLNRLARSVARATSVLARQAGVLVELSCTDGPLIAMGDREKLEQVVTNLVGNAIKFSNASGRVRIIASMLDDEVRLTVEDEGAGIPADKLDRVFDRFYQVDMSATRRRGGSGLGLAISKAIVKEHEGRIWAESPTSMGGTGARFVVSLPRPLVSDRSAGLSARPALLPGDSADDGADVHTVMLVDPDPGTVAGRRRTFEAAGFRVLTAANGTDALGFAREFLPGSIVIDATLPDLDGMDFASILKSDPLTRDIHIIFVNDLDEASEKRRTELGCGLVSGPLGDEAVLGAVRDKLA